MASNAKVNWEKSIALSTTPLSPKEQEVWPGKWAQEGEIVKYLGVPISLDQNHETQWSEVLKKFTNSFEIYHSRHLFP